MASDNKEKLSKLDAKLKQLQAQKNALLAREKEKDRKARTRRLIQIGAIIESIGIDSVELANTFKNYFEDNEKSNAWLKTLISKHQTGEK